MFRKLFVVAFGMALGIGGGHATNAAQTIRAWPTIGTETLRGASTVGPEIIRVRNDISRAHVLNAVLRSHFRDRRGARLYFHGLTDNRFRLGFEWNHLAFNRAYIQDRFTSGGGAYRNILYYYPSGHWGYHGAYYQGYPDTGDHAVYTPGQDFDERYDNLYDNYYDN
jgi:hypothetical protein